MDGWMDGWMHRWMNYLITKRGQNLQTGLWETLMDEWMMDEWIDGYIDTLFPVFKFGSNLKASL
jgi:hypothetical protein